jgi:MFS transporter, ACS family, hexuronate transporter
LPIVAPLVARDLRLDPAQLGLVFSLFSFGYAMFCFVGGYLSDRVGPKRVVTASMAAWSVFCGLTGAAFNFPSLLAVRLLFGMGEGPLGSAINKMAGQWFPRREQATAVGMSNAGTPLGGAVAGPVVGLIAIHFGWRMSFAVIAIAGVLWTLVWVLLAADRPSQHRWMGASELAEIEIDRGGSGVAAPALLLGDYLRRPAVLIVAFAFFDYACLLYFFLSWFPTYLTAARHLSMKSMSLVMMIPWLFGFLGITLSGWLTDAVFRRTGRAVFARKLVLVGGLAVASACVTLAVAVADVRFAVALMAVSLFSLYLTGATYWAIILDMVHSSKVGGVSGFVHLIASLGGVVSPAATGLLVQWTGTFTSAFILAGALAATGALAVAIWVRAPE